MVDANIYKLYKCSIDLHSSVFSNAVNILLQLPLRQYTSKITNLAFHDLTEDNSVPAGANLLLGLGSKFIPSPPKTTGIKDLKPFLFRFKRDLYRAAFYGDTEDDEDDFTTRPKLKLKSDWEPMDCEVPEEISQRIRTFFDRLEELFTESERPARSNLRPFELDLLKALQADVSLIIANADKGLGPVAVRLARYIKDALVHLEDESTYDIISSKEASSLTNQVVLDISAWVDKFRPYTDAENRANPRRVRPHAGALSDDEAKYILTKTRDAHRDSPNAFFYLLYKLHKGPPIKTRPVCSTCGSIAEAIGQYVNEKLQPIARAQRSWFRDSFTLKKLLDKITLPPNAQLYTSDATAMYTNIDSNAALEVLSEYLRRPEVMSKFDYNADCLIEAIAIVLRSNIIKFGDIFARQKKGVAMGICPAPPIAIIFFAVHEEYLLSKWGSSIFFYLRFIDDVFGIWLTNPDRITDESEWEKFQEDMNKFNGLPWEFTKRTSKVDFMDMTISINGNKLSTDLFEKEMALYLFIPPHSAHTPSSIIGLVTGQMLRIFSLCSEEQSIQVHVYNFFHRLLARGYEREYLLPIFHGAANRARDTLQRTEEEAANIKKERIKESRKKLYFHRFYHPSDPSASAIQRIFQDCVLHPPGRRPLNELETLEKSKINKDGLIICNHRHMNLGNYLSYRNIENRSGEKVSTYLKRGPP